MTALAFEDVQRRLPEGLRVREAGLEDVELLVEFFNEFSRPGQLNSVENVRRFEEHNPQPNRLMLVVEDPRGRVMAVGETSDGGMFRPPDGAHRSRIRVRPEAQRKGIGTALLERLESHARSKAAPKIAGAVREDEPDGVHFAKTHGYVERNRRYNSYVDVSAFDPSRFDEPDEIARRAGVRLVTLRELAAEHSADVDAIQREIYEFGRTVGADVPRPDPIPMPPYEAIREAFFGKNKSFDEDASIAAMHEGRPVSLTINEERTPGIYYTDFTGTAREWRGKGLALALKLRALRVLKAKGARLFGTTNDEANAAMRGINARLGYVPDPPVIEVLKLLT